MLLFTNNDKNEITFPRKNSLDIQVSSHLLLIMKADPQSVIETQHASIRLTQSFSLSLYFILFSNCIPASAPSPECGEWGTFASSSPFDCTGGSSSVILSMNCSTFCSLPKIESLNFRYVLWSIGMKRVVMSESSRGLNAYSFILII